MKEIILRQFKYYVKANLVIVGILMVIAIIVFIIMFINMQRD